MGKESNNLILFVKPRLARVKNQPNTSNARNARKRKDQGVKNDLFNTQMTYHK